NAGGLYFYVNSNGTGVHAPGVPPNKVWDGNWHLVAGTFDGSTVRFYLNGAQIGNGTAVPSGSIDYNQTVPTFSIADYAGPNRPCDPISTSFTGYMDELRVYDQALTPTEIGRLADYGGSTPPPLVLDPPIVHTSAATQVTDSSALLNGTIDDRGYNTAY